MNLVFIFAVMDYERETQEAIWAGQRALDSLHYAREQLSAARGFGIWDLLGGKSFVSVLKHVKISRAREAMAQAKYDLQAFDRELGDISMNITIDISDLLTVFDFFDSFIADVMVQSRIAEACRRLDEAIYRVEQVLKTISNK